MSSNVDKIDTGKFTQLYCTTYSVVSTLSIITKYFSYVLLTHWKVEYNYVIW